MENLRSVGFDVTEDAAMADLYVSHAEAMMIHARRRMHERFGLSLTDEEYQRMCEVIRDCRPIPVAFTVGG